MDADLTHLMKVVLRLNVTKRLSILLALEHAGCETFLDFCALPYNYQFSYLAPNPGMAINPMGTNLLGVVAERSRLLLLLQSTKS